MKTRRQRFRAPLTTATDPVGVYIAYYRNQDYGRKLITSTNEAGHQQ